MAAKTPNQSGIIKITQQNLKWLPKKTLIKFQSICHDKNNQRKFKMAATKLLRPSPNIIVT